MHFSSPVVSGSNMLSSNSSNSTRPSFGTPSMFLVMKRDPLISLGKPKQDRRRKKLLHQTFNEDVVLLLGPTDNLVVKQLKKQRLYERGHILNAFEFNKSWDHVDILCKVHRLRQLLHVHLQAWLHWHLL